MKNWKTWAGAGITAAAGSITGSMNLSGLSSSLVTGVGSSLNSGLTTGNWADSFKQGAITSIGNYIGNSIAGGMTGEGGLNTSNEYTKQLISNYTTFAAKKLLGSDEKFDMNTIGNVDTISMLINQTYSGIKSSRQAEYEKANRDRLIESGLSPEELERTLRDAGTAETGAKAADRFKDPLAGLDMALSGVFVSLGRGLGQTMNQIGESIKSGAEAVWSGVKDVAVSAWSEVTGAVSSAVGAVGTFAERTGNWFTEGHFVSDAEVKQIREQERLQQEQESIRNGIKPVGMSDAEYKQKFKELEQQAKDAESSKQRVVINGKEKFVNGEQKVDIELLKQDEVGRKACYFASVVMLAEAIIGKTANLLDVFNTAQDQGYTDDVGTVKSYEGVARSAGADVKDGSLISQDVTDPNKTIDTMIKQLDNKNPILIQLSGSHAEVVYGYEVKDGNLRFLVHDPGYQKDTYLDASNLQPYQAGSNGKQYYSTERGGPAVRGYNDYRKVFRIKYFKR